MKQLFLILFIFCAPVGVAAEIKLTGQAKMGLRYENGKTIAAAGTRVTARFSGETDGGLEFGAIIDLDQTGSGVDSVFRNTEPRAQFYISSGNHSLHVGKGVESAAHSLID